MALAPVGSTSTSAQGAFGLEFQSLLRIILTQLTYQDPLKPMDNFQFVSQLAQFSQLQQTQSMSDKLESLLSAQSANQATGLLGRTVDFTDAGGATLSGDVKAVSFATGQPTLTILVGGQSTISGISIASIAQVR